MGLGPKKTSASRGGEYHCPCPSCGGKDRFMFWPKQDRYWCRQCKKWGNSIQFLRDFQGVFSFKQAQATAKRLDLYTDCLSIVHPDFSQARRPTKPWIQRAEEFIESSHHRLLVDLDALQIVTNRGLTLETIRTHRLGWNPVETFPFRVDWGLEEDATRKKLFLPKGIVIPSYDVFGAGAASKIKIRRTNWIEGDKWPKYHEVPGSSTTPSFYGLRMNQVVVLLESEMDAFLVIQETRGLCSCVALGGVQKRPHPSLKQLLLEKELILFALDFDTAGKKEYAYWQQSYPNLQPWPAPEEKSPGDAYQKGVNLRMWIECGLRRYL